MIAEKLVAIRDLLIATINETTSLGYINDKKSVTEEIFPLVVPTNLNIS